MLLMEVCRLESIWGGFELDTAKLIGSQSLDVVSRQPIHHDLVWMAVGVVPTAADHGVSRMHRFQP